MEQKDILRQKIAVLVDEYAILALAPKPFTAGTSVVPPSGKVIGESNRRERIKKHGGCLAGWMAHYRAV